MNQPFQHVHFLGICGTAMGAVAVALKQQGIIVTGSDDGVYPPMSDYLRDAGIAAFQGFSPANLPPQADLIVVGNTIKRGNVEVEEVLNRKLPYFSLPETLRNFLLRGKHNLVVTGTHGKTTTTSLLAWILEKAGKHPSWLIGGIPNNLGEGARFTDSPFFVLEGDEYDTAFFDKRSKFVHYLPELLIINNLEFDHADIFKDLDDIKLSFRRVVNIVPSNGIILTNADDENALDVCTASPAPVMKVGLSEKADAQVKNIRYEGANTSFQIFDHEFTLPMTGEYNIRNAAMAIAAARFYGIPVGSLPEAVATFTGVRRRQEVRGEVRGVKIIDDFGHHPTAIKATLEGLGRKYPQGRIWAAFEPRSNTTRRAIFQEILPSAFSAADGSFIAPVARPEQLPEHDRLSPERVAESIRAGGGKSWAVSGVDEIIERLRSLVKEGDVIVVFSNGGFGDIHERLLKEL